MNTDKQVFHVGSPGKLVTTHSSDIRGKLVVTQAAIAGRLPEVESKSREEEKMGDGGRTLLPKGIVSEEEK